MNWDTVKHVGFHAVLAGCAVALTYVANHLGDLQLGANAAILTGLLSVAINGGLKVVNGMLGTDASAS